jgi:hypothetical protein
LDGSHREIVHHPANLSEFTRSCKDPELEFHTLQTVQHSAASTTLLQTIPAIANEIPTPNTDENLMQNLCSLDNNFNNGVINDFIITQPPVVNPQSRLFTFTAAAPQTVEQQPVSKMTIQTQVLPIFTPELKYDPKLDFAIKQELEKNTKELQEICDSTSIGFIPVPESAVVCTVPDTVVPETVLKIEPTAENLDKIVQQIMMPEVSTPTPVEPAKPAEPVSATDAIKRKLAAKSKKKKMLEEGSTENITPAPTKTEPPVAPVIVQKSDVKVDCKLCGKFFNTHDMLIKHCQQNCSGRTQPGADTTCQICGEKLADRKLYLKHKKEEHPESLLTCSACNKTFFLMQSLARHQKQTCTNRVEYTCRKCKSQHDSLESLRTHTQSVHPENVVCHICQKVLATSQSLKRHIKSHAKDGNANPESPSKFDLSETMDSSNQSLKKLSLNQIDMSEDLSLNDLSNWGNSAELIENINIDAEDNFEEELMLFSSDTLTCEFCGSSFSTNKLLLKHLSSQHFPNTHWQGRSSPVEESDVTGRTIATSVSCNDS